QRNSDPGASAKRSRYAICAASPVVLSIAVSQTIRRKTRQMNTRYFISGRVYFDPHKYPLKSECFREYLPRGFGRLRCLIGWTVEKLRAFLLIPARIRILTLTPALAHERATLEHRHE